MKARFLHSGVMFAIVVSWGSAQLLVIATQCFIHAKSKRETWDVKMNMDGQIAMRNKPFLEENNPFVQMGPS